MKLRDRILKSGRAAWRKELGPAQRLQPPAEDICTRLDAWRQAGYPVDQAPKLNDPALDELFGQSDDLEKRIARAGKRMRKLGVRALGRQLWGGIGFLISG